MNPLRISLLELPVYANTLPLVAGYLQTYAQQDPLVSAGCEFSIQAPIAQTPVVQLIDDLARQEADVYAMSCYLWNMRRMKEVLDDLVGRRPDALFVLGGPQVMNHASEYVPSTSENVLVCNGEGEVPFRALLAELVVSRRTGTKPDFDRVPGMSFWSAGKLVTTDKPPRVKDLDEIPSPFAASVFKGEYTFAVVETNRGCPFSCSYCYWGAATNDKVHRWDFDRVKADLTWISEHGIESIFIADANWGALPRDVDLSHHLVACRKRTGYPLMVAIQAAKNRPDRVAQVTEILVDGGMLTSQPISLQTLSTEALTLVQRTNIKRSTYTDLQLELHQKQISSYTELVWPLPGETLKSFREGIAEICRAGADAVVAYPHLLLRNTPMYNKREELGIVTTRVADPVAEADMVMATKWVTPDDVRAGFWFYYAVISLYNARSAYHVAKKLDREGTSSYEEFLTLAAEYCRRRTDTEICRFFADSARALGNYDLNNLGKVLHMVLHSHRAEMDALLEGFLAEHGWLADSSTRAAFELDLIARPYVYREAIVVPSVRMSHLQIVSQGRYEVEIEASPAVVAALAPAGLSGDMARDPSTRLVVDHRGRHKMPYPRLRSLEHNAAYCQAMMNRVRDILPTWRLADGALNAP